MKLSTCLLQFFKFCDLFSLSHFLRYKGQSDYKTASGGVISLIVVCIFSALFLNVAIATINKSIINWNSQTTFSNDPTPTTINTSTSNFMFTVGLIGLNVNDPNVRYFDFNLYSRLNGQAGVVLKSDKVPLQPCRIQHFYMNQQIYSEMPASSWLCPPLNFSYQLYGKFMSNKMSYLIVEIAKCKPSSSDPRPCATDSTIDYMIQSYGPLNVAFFYTNPLINPGKADYLSYYLKAQNWVSFTKTLGAITVAYVQDFQINTDESLLPFTKNHVDAGVSIPDIFQTVTNQVTSDTYVSWAICKSSVQKTYTRSFNKVDQFFSYVGGLVGTILALMFFMANFTSMAFGLDLAQGIFRYKQKEDANFQNFNLLTYIAFIPYKIGKFFNRCKHWKEMKKREQCFDEVEKQLDISLILRKINFLERSVESMLGEEEYKLKHYSENECLAQVKARRRLYSINKKKQNGQQEHDESESDKSEQEGEGTVKDPDEMQNSNIHQHSFQKFKIHSQIHSQLGLADHFQNNKLDLGQKDPSYRNQQKRKLFKFNQATQLQPHNQLFFDIQDKQIAIDSANINPNGQIIKKDQQKNGQKFKQ